MDFWHCSVQRRIVNPGLIYIYIYGSNDNLPWSLIWSLVRPDQSFTFAKKQSGPFAIDATPKIIGISRRRHHHHHPHPHPRHRDLPTSQHWDIKTWASTLTAQEQLRFRLLNATGSSPKMAAGWIQSMPQLLRKFNTVSVQKSSHSKREPHRNHASTIRNCFCAASAISAAGVSRSKRVSILLTHLGRCGTRWQVGPGCLPLDGLPQAVLCLSLLRILTSVQVSYLHISEKYMRNWKQTRITSERSTTLQDDDISPAPFASPPLPSPQRSAQLAWELAGTSQRSRSRSNPWSPGRMSFRWKIQGKTELKMLKSDGISCI